jgi:hypothetical protein
MDREIVTGQMAHVLADRLTAQGYQVEFPPGRDPAAFLVISLPGAPDVEVTAEDGGQASCHYTGRSTVEASGVIARLRAPGDPQTQGVSGDTLIGTWDDIAVEWHYLPPAGQPASADQIGTALLAHLALLAGSHSRETHLGEPACLAFAPPCARGDLLLT